MIDEDLELEILKITDDFESIDAAGIEFKDTLGQDIPYTKILKTYGVCYQWSDGFINNMLLAFATDRLDQFAEDELDAWYSFVSFEDYHSHSALDTDCNTLAVGCTIPDELFRSFVVCESGNITTTKCQDPRYDVQNEQIWASLDRAFMDLYNCIEIDDCGIDDTYGQNVPCPI